MLWMLLSNLHTENVELLYLRLLRFSKILSQMLILVPIQILNRLLIRSCKKILGICEDLQRYLLRLLRHPLLMKDSQLLHFIHDVDHSPSGVIKPMIINTFKNIFYNWKNRYDRYRIGEDTKYLIDN